MCFCDSSGDVALNNLVIKQCGTPAVALEHPDVVENTIPTEKFSSFQMSLRDVRFEQNGDIASLGADGGALSISAGWNVNVTGCQFVNNRAPVGGAIFAVGSHLLVENSTFKGNSARFKVLTIAAFLTQMLSSNVAW